jgi:hypothetical protein
LSKDIGYQWAALAALLAFFALAFGSQWREVPFVYTPAPAADNEQAPVKPATQALAAVLPFDDILVVAQDGSVLDKDKPTVAPQPLRREGAAPSGSGERPPSGDGASQRAGIVCELGADSTRLGRVDGKALARALTQELAGARIFDGGVRDIESARELQEQTVLIEGKVLEASLRILKNGDKEYAVGLELSAARAYGRDLPVEPPFWKVVLRRKARAGGAPAAYDINTLVRGLYAEAVKGLGDTLRR